MMMNRLRFAWPSPRPQASSHVDSRRNLLQKLKQTKMPVFFKYGQSFSFDIGDEEGLSEEARWNQLKPNPNVPSQFYQYQTSLLLDVDAPSRAPNLAGDLTHG